MDSCISMSSHRTFSALIQFSMPCHSWQVLPHSWQVFSLTRIIFSQTGLQAKLNLGNPSFRLLFQVSQPLNSQTQHFSHIYQSYHPTMSYDTPYKGSSLFKRSDPDKDRKQFIVCPLSNLSNCMFSIKYSFGRFRKYLS